MKKMLDEVPEADAGGGGFIGRILDEGCWLSIIDVIMCCVGGLPEILESELESSLSARWFAIRTHGFNHPSGIDQSPGAKVLVPGQQTMKTPGVIHGSLATDHWNWMKKKYLWTWNCWMVNIWRASLVIEGFRVSRCRSSRFMAYSKAPLFSAARKPVHPEPWIWMVDRKWRSTACCHALNLVQPGSK